MKLVRFGPPGQEQPGLLDADGKIRSLVGVVDDVAGITLSAASLDRLRHLNPKSLPLAGRPSHVAASDAADSNASFGETRLRIGPCVGRVGKVMCIGLN